MVSNILKKIFGSRNERLVKRLSKTVSQINQLEAELQQLPDEALSAKTAEFRGRLEEGAALWNNVNNKQGQLGYREFWYSHIGDEKRLAAINAAKSRW